MAGLPPSSGRAFLAPSATLSCSRQLLLIGSGLFGPRFPSRPPITDGRGCGCSPSSWASLAANFYTASCSLTAAAPIRFGSRCSLPSRTALLHLRQGCLPLRGSGVSPAAVPDDFEGTVVEIPLTLRVALHRWWRERRIRAMC
jgi:hypothetical protein